MKVLTVGMSPYLLVHIGKINKSLICGLKKDGHVVASAVWHHDSSYFLPNDNGEHEFEQNGEVICRLYPFANYPEKNAPALYEIIKNFEPDVVISIGDYTDTDFIFSIKALMPNQFKWISILTIDSPPINEKRKEAFEFIDLAVVANKMALKEVKKISRVETRLIRFGPDHGIFYKDNDVIKEEANLRVMSCSKNSQASSTAVFMKSIVEANKIYNGITGYLHTNVSDRGDYDLDLLMNRFEAGNCVFLPDKFVSLNDGISDKDLNSEYNKSDIIVDLSVRSSTGLTVLEGMSTGCIPLTVDIGANGEVVGLIDKSLIISSNTYIGQFEEYYEIPSPEDFTKKLIKLYELKRDNKDFVENLIRRSVDVSNQFSEEKFVEGIKDVLKNISIIDRKVEVEIL